MAVDYTKFNNPGASQDQSANFNRYWWKSTLAELPQAIAYIVKTISDFDGKRQTQYQISNRLYGNADIMGVNGLAYARTTQAQGALKDRISYNVIQSCIDTITAKIAKNRPKSLFLTSGGDYKRQRRAQKLSKFVEGVFYENEMNKLAPMVFRNACINGDGYIHVFPEYGKIKYELVMSEELYVDQVDGFYGHPRQLHRVKNADRAMLVDLFPEHKNAILQANNATENLIGAHANIADQITIVESWHLPSGPGAKDGLHVICTQDKILFKEEWTKPFFPFARMSWTKPTKGYWSQGLAAQLQNIQLEINKLLWLIQRSMHLAGSFKIFLDNSSKIVKEHLSNDIGAIISYTGQQPTYLTPPIVPQEVYAHLQTLKNSAYEVSGISQLSATSQKPAGLNSGKALREYNDIETERFMVVGQAYENLHLDVAKLTVSVAKDIYAEDKNFSVRVPGRKSIEFIKWADVDLAEDDYIMKIFPVSSLPEDPAGRLQTVQEYVQAGFYTPRTAKRLLDFPDLEAVDNLQSAQEDYLHKILEKIVEDGEFTSPEPDDDLNLALELGLEYLAQGKRDNLEEDKKELLRNFIDQVNLLKAKAQQAAAPLKAKAQQAAAPQPGLGPQMAQPQAPAQPMQASPLVNQVQ